MVKCPNCGKGNWESADKCWYCHYPLEPNKNRKKNLKPKETIKDKLNRIFKVITFILIFLIILMMSYATINSYNINHPTNSNQSYNYSPPPEEQELINSPEFQRGITKYLQMEYPNGVDGEPSYYINDMSNPSNIRVSLTVYWKTSDGHSGYDDLDLIGTLESGNYFIGAKRYSGSYYNFENDYSNRTLGSLNRTVTYCPNPESWGCPHKRSISV